MIEFDVSVIHRVKVILFVYAYVSGFLLFFLSYVPYNVFFPIIKFTSCRLNACYIVYRSHGVLTATLTYHLHAELIVFINYLSITSTFIDELVICSLNVRGLNNTLKGRETFRWLRMKKFGIYFLQEVHCTKDKEPLWSSE